MKYLIVFLFIVFSVSAAYGSGKPANDCKTFDLKMIQKFEPCIVGYGPNHERNDAACRAAIGDAARSGCCSHHQGVCGCRGNRAVCCDGILSPTCGCD